MSKTIKDEDFQKRAKEVIGSFAKLGPESEFVPGEDESFEEWYSRVFGGPVMPPLLPGKEDKHD